MTNQELNDFIANHITGKSASDISQDIISSQGGYVRDFNNAISGPDVKDNITRLALLITGYLDTIGDEVDGDAQTASTALATIRELAEHIYDVIGDSQEETGLTWKYGFVQSNGHVSESETPTRAIMTNAVPRDVDVDKIEYTGESYSGNTPYFVHLAEYRPGTLGENTFIKRTTLHYAPTNIHNVVELDEECTQYLYVFGFEAGTGVIATIADAGNFAAKKYSDKTDALQREVDTIEQKLYGTLTPITLAMTVGNVNAITGAISSSSSYYVRPIVPVNVSGHKYLHFTSPVTSGQFPYGVAFYSAGLYDGDTISETPEIYFISGSENAGKTKIGYEWRTIPVPDGATWAMLNYWSDTATYHSVPFQIFYADNYENGSDYAARHSSGGVSDDYIVEESRRLGLHTIPENMMQLNIVRRCRQMTDIKWTPAVDLPRVNMVGGEIWIRNIFKAGIEYTGIPYTKCSDTDEETETDYDFVSEDYEHDNFYVGFGIKPETFVTAVQNANSMVCVNGTDMLENEEYTEYPPDHPTEGIDTNHIKHHVGLPYGLVCSALASYSLGLNAPKTAAQIKDISGITQKAEKLSDWWDGEKIADRLKLGDILNYSGHHSAIITDIIHDTNDDIVYIEVSEATPTGNGNEDVFGGRDGGVCRRKGFSPAGLISSRGENYAVLRYTVTDVPYSQDKFTRLHGEPDMYRLTDLSVMPYEGSGFVYKKSWLNDNQITLIISTTGYNRLLVYSDDNTLIDTITIQPDATSQTIEASGYAIGDYKVCLALYNNNIEHHRTAYGYFSVTN